MLSAEECDETFVFTSESVGSGHPDKVCDQISDAILDEALRQDPSSKIAIETVVKSNFVLVAGEMRTLAVLDIEKIVRGVIADIGYTDAALGFDAATAQIDVRVSKQSDEIFSAVDGHEMLGAGDQGMMFGYATEETPERLPITLSLSHGLVRAVDAARKTGEMRWIKPDCKVQVTVLYGRKGRAIFPLEVADIVMSVQHSEDAADEDIKRDLAAIIARTVPAEYLSPRTVYKLQPSGRFVLGGPVADTGLTGRKIIVDTYGGWGAHGGGAFSGKDASKVDRSGAYAARWIAKSLVDGGLCSRVLVQISYAIGSTHPVSVFLDTYGTSSCPNAELLALVQENFDLRPGKIISALNLQRAVFRETARYGHFGNPQYAWEKSKDLRRRRIQTSGKENKNSVPNLSK